MPEGPELHLASRFVNKCCRGFIFSGKIIKSDVHKSDDIKFQSDAYTISAKSRGKELQLFLSSISDDEKEQISQKKKKKDPQSHTTILFRFGMSGKFEFTTEENIHKHAHLKFFSLHKPRMVLSYVDVRRFGRWEETSSWGKDRGPDPMFEYQDFRSNVLKNLPSHEFDHPICEVLLNQKYFNGIGNYLRAEILYRLKIPPFEVARKVLEGLEETPPDVKPNIKGQVSKVKVKEIKTDILHLCHTVPLEVTNLGGGGYDPEGNKADYNAFTDWLQCYYQDDMKTMVDHNKRTIWFAGPAGPMVPKEGKSRTPTKRKKIKTEKEKPSPKPKKAKKEKQKPKTKEPAEVKDRKQKGKPKQKRNAKTGDENVIKKGPAKEKKVGAKEGGSKVSVKKSTQVATKSEPSRRSLRIKKK